MATATPGILDQYIAIEQAFYNQLVRTLGDNLLLYCLTGSLSRRDITANWSDIDILLVVDHFSPDTFENIQAAVSKHKKHVKIGVTFYSKAEFETNAACDPKSLFSIRSIREGRLAPRRLHPTLALPDITEERLKAAEAVDYTKALHDFKRQILVLSPDNEQKTYKSMITLLKICLIQRGHYATSYAGVIEAARRHLPEFDFVLHLPTDVLEHPANVMQRYPDYMRVLYWLNKHGSKVVAHASR